MHKCINNYYCLLLIYHVIDIVDIVITTLKLMISIQVEVCGDTLVGSDKDNNLFFKTHTSSDVKGDYDDTVQR